MNKLYEQWLEASEVLTKAKRAELQLRTYICKLMIPADKMEGQLTIEDDGYKVIPKAILNRTVNEDVLKAIWNDLSDDEKACISYKPVVVERLFRKFEEEGGRICSAITVKQGVPRLNIERVEG